MNSHKSVKQALVCIVLLTFTLGCTTTQSLTTASPQAMANSVAVGDTIAIERKDGTSLEFDITEVSAAGIRGNGIFVPYADIHQASVNRVTWVGMTLFAILAIGVWYVLEKNSDCGLFSYDSDECTD